MISTKEVVAMVESAGHGQDLQTQAFNLVSDFYGGLSVLTVLGGRSSAILTREVMLDSFAAFEAAVGPLAELQAAGKLQGLGTLSAESRERIAQIGRLLRLAPAGADTQGAAAEIRTLAEQRVQALLPNEARSPTKENS